uniref:Uncharacterized protein n=1 Tax=Rhizophora mucronata TaxID=61149 RepID=A0A2P2QW81_RHIMU
MMEMVFTRDMHLIHFTNHFLLRLKCPTCHLLQKVVLQTQVAQSLGLAQLGEYLIHSRSPSLCEVPWVMQQKVRT